MGVLLEPFPEIGGRRPWLAGAAGVCTLENRDMIPHEALRPRIPFRIGDTGTVLRSDVEIVVLRSARRRQIGISHTAVAADRYGIRSREPLLRCRPRHTAEAAAQLVGQTLWDGVGRRQSADQRMNAQCLPGARERDSPV